MAPEAQTNDPYENLQPGDRVKHPKFGDGTIMQRAGTGDNTKLVVAFAEEGEKYLLARYAKLRKIQPIETKEEKSVAAVAAAPVPKAAPKSAEGAELEEEEEDVEVEVEDVFDEEDFLGDDEEELVIKPDEEEEE